MSKFRISQIIQRGIFGIRNTDCGCSNQSVREQWMESRLAAIPDGTRILDAGAGERRYEKFCKHLDYVAQDFGQYDGAGDEKGLHTGKWDQSRLDIVSDITEIPEPDASFGAVMCFEVFEHLPQVEAAVEELSRLLKPGGKLLITAPFCSLTHFAPYHFCSGFNRYFYEEIFPKYGLEILELDKNGNYFSYLAQEIRRIGNMQKKYALDAPRPGIRKRFLRKVAHKAMLEWLDDLNTHDQGSSDLLFFGMHVLAEKKV